MMANVICHLPAVYSFKTEVLNLRFYAVDKNVYGFRRQPGFFVGAIDPNKLWLSVGTDSGSHASRLSNDLNGQDDLVRFDLDDR